MAASWTKTDDGTRSSVRHIAANHTRISYSLSTYLTTEISAGDTFPLQIDKSKATANINPVFLVDISRSPSLDILCKYSRSLRRPSRVIAVTLGGRLPIKRRRFTPWAADIKSADFCGLREREFDHLLFERFSALSPWY